MRGRAWRPGDAPPVPFAVVVAGVVAGVQLLGCLGAARAAHVPLPPTAVTLLLLGPLAIATLHRYRLAPMAVAIAATVTYAALGYPLGPVFAAPVAALWLEFVRGRRERWAAARREAQLARDRRATEERVTVARELHDVIGHSLSLINVQAGVALHLLDSHPENARPALGTIKAVSHDALEEVRLVLESLRDPTGAAARSPSPTLADVATLLDRAGVDGTAWSLEVRGTRGRVPAAVDAAAYRVVQEAMTNVRRHARAAHAGITVTYGEDWLDVCVTDDGVGSGGVVEGAGTAGMRERVSALGGTFAAGPQQSGYAVSAHLPWGASAGRPT
ncbi:sensor histidine kinase [Oryzihumus sp.]|uniref:sensor histidine kinase n=1 Tax=Oryzihumus sp. TaxID=1968903 RepID=UPI002ED92FE7